MAERVMPDAGLDPATAVIPVNCSNDKANRARRIWFNSPWFGLV